MKHILLSIFIIIAICLVAACSDTKVQGILNHAESIMEEHPDSALSILSKVDKDSISSKKELARYSLLMSMALDKNYIDTTSFDVLQPAIDYYLDKEKGSVNERLRTLYYQGRIYQNMGDENNAMTSFIRASETEKTTDTLTLARTHVAISVLSSDIYAPEEMTKHALNAANLYESIGRLDLQMDCYNRALGGCLLSKNQHQADSIIGLYKNLTYKYDGKILSKEDWAVAFLTYALTFGNEQDIKDNIDITMELENLHEGIIIEIARGYLNLGEKELSERYINLVDSLGPMGNKDKYLIVKSEIYEANGKYKDALDIFKRFQENEGDRVMSGESYDLMFVNEQHAKELSMLKSKQHNNYIIWGAVSCVLILTAILSLLFYRHKLIKTQMELLQSQTEQLEIEKKNAELDKKYHMMKAENQRIRIGELNEEIESLKEMLASKDSPLSTSIEKAVKERIEMLNSLIASAITNNPKYSTPYDEWKEKIIQDHVSFMNSTRLAFKASHPALIEHLEQHGLTEAEINYACLYALGMNGKEVGKYIHSQRHYHISSDIRKKLGLDINNTNLGNYIRKLMEQE